MIGCCGFARDAEVLVVPLVSSSEGPKHLDHILLFHRGDLREACCTDCGKTSPGDRAREPIAPGRGKRGDDGCSVEVRTYTARR